MSCIVVLCKYYASLMPFLYNEILNDWYELVDSLSKLIELTYRFYLFLFLTCFTQPPIYDKLSLPIFI